jgi:hypothetical protein
MFIPSLGRCSLLLPCCPCSEQLAEEESSACRFREYAPAWFLISFPLRCAARVREVEHRFDTRWNPPAKTPTPPSGLRSVESFQACETAFAIPADLPGGDEFGGERIPLINRNAGSSSLGRRPRCCPSKLCFPDEGARVGYDDERDATTKSTRAMMSSTPMGYSSGVFRGRLKRYV